MPVQAGAASRRPALRLATLNVAGRLADHTTTVAHSVDDDVDVLALHSTLRGRSVQCTSAESKETWIKDEFLKQRVCRCTSLVQT
jgi:hypothetical protein